MHTLRFQIFIFPFFFLPIPHQYLLECPHGSLGFLMQLRTMQTIAFYGLINHFYDQLVCLCFLPLR